MYQYEFLIERPYAPPKKTKKGIEIHRTAELLQLMKTTSVNTTLPIWSRVAALLYKFITADTHILFFPNVGQTSSGNRG
jgi:hypothetical protein